MRNKTIILCAKCCGSIKIFVYMNGKTSLFRYNKQQITRTKFYAIKITYICYMSNFKLLYIKGNTIAKRKSMKLKYALEIFNKEIILPDFN